MTGAETFDLLLFVAGEPDNGTGHYEPLSIAARLFSAAVPMQLFFAFDPRQTPRPGGSNTDDLPWRLPPDQVRVVNDVLEEAVLQDRKVTVVDVNRSAPSAEFVRTWVTADEIYPILIRPDGQRLEGFENFDSKSLHQFLRPPKPHASTPLP
jgi:hypothetical protein